MRIKMWNIWKYKQVEIRGEMMRCRSRSINWNRQSVCVS